MKSQLLDRRIPVIFSKKKKFFLGCMGLMVECWNEVVWF